MPLELFTCQTSKHSRATFVAHRRDCCRRARVRPSCSVGTPCHTDLSNTRSSEGPPARAAPATGSRARCSNDLLRPRAENPGGRTASLVHPTLTKTEVTMNSDDDLIAEVMVRPLKPVHIAIEQACLHPLVRHAVIDERGYVQWPHFTERQKQVAADTVRLIRVDGWQYFSLPPRVNADWFLPENPTPDDLRTIFGSTPDLQRWYLSIDLMSGARDTLLVTSVTLNGQRAFFACSTTSSWVRIAARTFTSWRDGADFVLTPVDRLVATEWRREWNAASGATT